MGRLDGKYCLVTAAGQGIGRETVLAFVREGARVVAADIDETKLDDLAAENDAILPRVFDVTDANATKALFEELEPLDVIFNCAGYVHGGTILECDEAAWRRSFDINVDAMYRICRAVLPGMIENGGGSIVNMSSVASSLIGVPNRFAYGATKAAVIGLTKSIALDFVSQGIRCNAICPGTVKTPSLVDRIRSLPGDFEENYKAFENRQPTGRLGDAAEIAALALYLASDESKFTTGGVHVIDGGWTTA